MQTFDENLPDKKANYDALMQLWMHVVNWRRTHRKWNSVCNGL